MKFEIFKNYDDVADYINTVRANADKYKKELGFLPFSAYEDQALKGRLWVAVESNTKDFVGHLMFGGRFPSLKVTQMFVHPKYRKRQIASFLIEELAKYGEENNYLSISARVAEDLPANSFWESSGFKLSHKKAGGKTTKRVINVRCRDLNTPSLLTLMAEPSSRFEHHEKISYTNKPISSTPFYTMDLNILFDIVKDRASKLEASSVIMAALNNKIRLCVTDEFATELERNTQGFRNDPLLEFAKELPTLKFADEKKEQEILPVLRSIVFPQRKLDGRTAKQDNSDLRHLAKSICSRADGFITREKAILRAGQQIYDQFSLEIIPPADFLESTFDHEVPKTVITEKHSDRKIDFSGIREDDRQELLDFLLDSDINEQFDSSIWSPVTSGSGTKKWCIRADSIIVGVATWTPPNKISKTASLNIFIDEDHPSFTKIVDHVFETIFHETNGLNLFKISLNLGLGQTQTKALAIQRGFRAGVKERGSSISVGLVKTVCLDIITSVNWNIFSDEFASLTGHSLPSSMPKYQDVNSSWIVVKDKRSGSEYEMTLFEFETLLSPALFLCPDRDGLIIPIQHSYAVDIGIVTPSQMCFLPGKEALLHLERAYFRNKVRSNKFSKGMPILFYVSGVGEMSQNIVGRARITYSGVHSVEETKNKFSRQGVLPEKSLEETADKKGFLHIFTFDNYCQFNKEISYNTLKSAGHINAANYVTATPKTHEQMNDIISLAK